MSNIYQCKAQFICNQFLDDSGKAKRARKRMRKGEKKNVMAERKVAYYTIAQWKTDIQCLSI